MESSKATACHIQQVAGDPTNCANQPFKTPANQAVSNKKKVLSQVKTIKLQESW